MDHLNYAPRGPHQLLPAEYWQNMSHLYFTSSVVHGYGTPHTTGMSFTPSMSNEPATPTFVPETQLSDRESPIEVVDLEKAVSNAEGTRKRSSWTKVEDEVLARSFVTISDDPIIDNDQKADAFWGRVASYYNENLPLGSNIRSANVIRSHWHNTIQKKSTDHFVATKKTRTSESGASNTSSNQDVSIDLDYEDTRPMGQKFTEYTSVKKSEVDLKQKQFEVEEIKAKTTLSKSEAKNRRLELKEYEILNKDTSQMTKEQLSYMNAYARILALIRMSGSERPERVEPALSQGASSGHSNWPRGFGRPGQVRALALVLLAYALFDEGFASLQTLGLATATAKSNGGMEAGEQKPQAGGGLFASCSFDDLGLHPTLCQHLRGPYLFSSSHLIPIFRMLTDDRFSLSDKMGFQVPTKIQAQAIPVVISGRHSLVNAATGTGKTIVYLAPIVHLLQTYEPRIQRSDGTYALVLVPTRELCMQVYEILQKLLHCFHWIVPGYIMGGENRAKEKARLRKGISILIATPGRLLDHLKNTSSFQHTKLRWIVFDEADRILELGFGKAVEEILDILGSRQINHIPSNGKISNSVKCSRQNLLLSATLNEKVNHLANISLENPIMIGMDQNNSHIAHTLSVGNVTSAYVIDGDLKIHDGFASQTVENYNLPSQLVQKYVRVPSGSRLVILLSILRSLFEGKTSQKIVVFFSTCDAVDFHYALINEFKWSPSSLQEVKEQKFVSYVAARGLDIPKVRCIIQYDSPGEASEYVHRVGRTARLREKGEALLFLQPVEMDYLHDLQHHGVKLEEYQIQRCLDGFALHGKNFYKKSISLETHPWVLFLQKALETFISTEAKLNKLARNAFCSWVRAYTAHRGELKRIFLVKKLHLGHVARSFGLKDQPSWVGGSHKNEAKKRKKYGLKINSSKRRKTS
ncbi:hypothetical protein ZIOFF_026885 [Zingiber officinale]|uniref:ATP-dependent RNA helicase n=1 Tax=Zingiber officinale TaxID=94328 RepID=A0A8J5L7M1_ZINOF|nr:hypothetical protein ZIOFF_026885 [Zingiber officinale]